MQHISHYVFRMRLQRYRRAIFDEARPFLIYIDVYMVRTGGYTCATLLLRKQLAGNATGIQDTYTHTHFCITNKWQMHSISAIQSSFRNHLESLVLYVYSLFKALRSR